MADIAGGAGHAEHRRPVARGAALGLRAPRRHHRPGHLGGHPRQRRHRLGHRRPARLRRRARHRPRSPSTSSTSPPTATSRTPAATSSGTSTCRRSTAWRRGSPAQVLYFAPSLADSELTAALGAWVNDPNGPPIMNASLGECEQIPILNPILNNPLLNPINGNNNPDALPVSQAVSQASQPATTQLLQQAVMEGRNFFAASGDNGSSCTVAYPGANGVANEGVPLTSDPANTPFTTGVGGTVLYSDGDEPAGRALESAWAYSGGNSSPFIRAPDYQQGVANLGHPCVVDRTRPAEQHRPAVPRRARRRGAVGRRDLQRLHHRLRRRGRRRRRHEPLLAAVGGHVGRRPEHRAAGRHLRVRQPVDLRDRQGPRALRAPPSTTSPSAPTASTPRWPATTTSPASACRAWPGSSRRSRPSRASPGARRAPPPQRVRRPHRAGLELRPQARRARPRAGACRSPGTASDRGCRAGGAGRVKRVRVAVARQAGKRCRFLKGKKGFTASRAAARARVYLTRQGHRRAGASPSAAAWPRAATAPTSAAPTPTGNAPRKLAKTAIRGFRVR